MPPRTRSATADKPTADNPEPLTLEQASDEDTLREAISKSLPDADDSVKQAEYERHAAQVAAARQYRDSLDPLNPARTAPVVYPGA